MKAPGGRVVLVTVHFVGSKIRTGFHWLAEAYARAGHDVLVMTVSLSWLSILRRDFRMAFREQCPPRKIHPFGERLNGFVWYMPWHPMNLRLGLLNAIEEPFCYMYSKFPLGDAGPWLKDASLILFDSSPGLLLYERIRNLNPGARTVYRMSDDLRMAGVHPSVVRAQNRILPRFDLVSVPSSNMTPLGAGARSFGVHNHGIRKDLFDRDYPNPYKGPGPHVLWIGNRFLDVDFVARAARLFPSWTLHLAGLAAWTGKEANVVVHGELPFNDTLPLLKHADIGLACFEYRPGSESFTDSLKIIQYTYNRLPIVAPDFLVPARPNFFHYAAGDDASIKSALERAKSMDRSSVSREGIRSWDEVAAVLAGEPTPSSAGRPS